LIVIGITGYFADNGRLPRPLYPLSFLIIIIASYAVLIVYPSNGSVYAATLIGNAVTSAWYPMMWPWRVQTTSHATGSAFSIGFVNSYGQIGGAIGPQSKHSEIFSFPFSQLPSSLLRHTPEDFLRLQPIIIIADSNSEQFSEALMHLTTRYPSASPRVSLLHVQSQPS
jgi:hypothetical protein